MVTDFRTVYIRTIGVDPAKSTYFEHYFYEHYILRIGISLRLGHKLIVTCASEVDRRVINLLLKPLNSNEWWQLKPLQVTVYVTNEILESTLIGDLLGKLKGNKSLVWRKTGSLTEDELDALMMEESDYLISGQEFETSQHFRNVAQGLSEMPELKKNRNKLMWARLPERMGGHSTRNTCGQRPSQKRKWCCNKCKGTHKRNKACEKEVEESPGDLWVRKGWEQYFRELEQSTPGDKKWENATAGGIMHSYVSAKRYGIEWHSQILEGE